jgi:class 3 adenylate cyclase
MDVVVWLRSLGLGKYEAVFRENEIDETVLPNLTAEDFKELGITALGHRRKLLDAIAALRSDVSGKTPSAGRSDRVESTSSSRPEDRAERRQVTVMFSDLVGSTALSGRMDPEDLREVISAYQKCVAETVRRFGGFVAKYMGDGVLVYFGYPQAHEDDAERAVRAGLDLITAVSALKAPVSLQTRVGIATGLVVVGDLLGSGEAQERSIVGETPNLAARLQGIAEPNIVVIADATRKLLGNLFELDDLGSRDLKGITGPVRAWAALRASSVASRFEAQHETKLTPLVGRDEELELLLRRWRQAVGGKAVRSCCRANQGSASRDWRWRSSNSFKRSNICRCGTSAHRCTPTALSIPSYRNLNERRDLSATIRWKADATSYRHCLARRPIRTTTFNSSRIYCQSQQVIATRL